MIAVAENHGSTILLYRTVSAYENGREPIDWTPTDWSDDGIKALGYERSSDWKKSDLGTSFATVTKAKAATR